MSLMRVGFMFTLESPKRLDKAVKVPGGASFVIVTVQCRIPHTE